MTQKSDLEKISQSLREAGPYLGMGFQIAATLTVMWYLGTKLDEYFETAPTLMIICLFIGIFAAMYNFIKSAINSDKKKKSDKTS